MVCHYDDSHRHPIFSHYNASQPIVRPSRSKFWLPVELWHHVIRLLRFEPDDLFACCLTCKSFYNPAIQLWRELLHSYIEVSNHTEIDRYLEWILLAPNRAKCIRSLTLQVAP